MRGDGKGIRQNKTNTLTEQWWVSWLARQSKANLMLKVQGSNPATSVCNVLWALLGIVFGQARITLRFQLRSCVSALTNYTKTVVLS